MNYDDFRLCFFFFQAEDGIRDLVRSRGLGDVYKRQLLIEVTLPDTISFSSTAVSVASYCSCSLCFSSAAVSYTHLTLPTSDLV